MTTNGQRLRRVQVAGQHAIDRVYQPLAEQTEVSVIRHGLAFGHDLAGGGAATLPPLAVPLVLGDVSALLAGAEPRLVSVVLRHAGEAERVADPVAGPDALALAQTGAGVAISLRRNRAQVLGQVQGLLERGLSLALTPRQTALTVRQYFAPWFSSHRLSSRRSVTGGLERTDRGGAVRSWPGQAGMASQHVRGVMLYETTAANVRGMKRAALREGELLRYHVSHQHLVIDICDVHERADVGYGRGLYPPELFPIVPQHFRCRCWAEATTRPRFSARSEVA